MLKELNLWSRPGVNLESVERDLNDLFGSVFRGDVALLEQDLQVFAPRINVTDSEKDVRVTAELPGVDERISRST